MVSVLTRPTDGAFDDSVRKQHGTYNGTPNSGHNGTHNGSTGSRRGGERAVRLEQTSATAPNAVAERTADERRPRPTTWSCLTRRPGAPWRESAPTGPAMPARWAHSPSAAVAVPEPAPVGAAVPSDFRFGELDLTEPARRAVWEAGYRTPTPIQATAIPLLLAGRDVVGQAQTGTGKTAAFGIPIVERVDPSRKVVQAIVLLPTRELCRQVAEEVARLGKHRGIETLAVYGGEGMDRQLRALAAGVHVVVGTPGRVQDHIWRGTLLLDHVHIAVLDEADEMLDIGFAEAIERILRCVPTERQTALFSATIPPFVHTLVRRYLSKPEWVSTVDATQTSASRIPTQIRQGYIQVAERDKLDALEELTKSEPGYDRVLVFRRMKISADRLAEQMKRKGYSVRALHGDLPQGERNRVLEDFKAGRIQFLVATNVAARGLDIRDVSHVLNYDLPDTPEEYVHRIGRTGRAGKEGTAISFVGEWDFQAFEAIKTHVGEALRERALDLYGNR